MSTGSRLELNGAEGRRHSGEWPTWAALAACYILWMALTWFSGDFPLVLFVPAAACLVAFHASLTHEAIHGHPTRSALLNEVLVFPALGLFIPYRSFRTSHLRHHKDRRLTDPRDDPESWYLSSADWERLPSAARILLWVNNTLAGRLVLGPAITVTRRLAADLPALVRGERRVVVAYALHAAAVALVLGWVVGICGMNPWTYVFGAAYPGLALLMLRTFAEHRAHGDAPRRTAIVEASLPFALLFLNNNLHAVHHARPGAPWYALPQIYKAERARWLERNGGYHYRGYTDLARRHLFRAKESVVHPVP